MNGQPLLSIIIVNHRADEILPDCLRAIAGSDRPPTMEVIIVDNPAPPTPSSAIIPDDPVVRRIDAPKRYGFGAACNLGVKHATGEYLVFLNPDVILDPWSLKILYRELTEREEAGMVVGRLIGPDMKFQASCRRFPTWKNLLLSRGSVLHRLFGLGGEAYTLPDYSEVTEVEAAAAAMMMLSKENFEALSGFDESFFIYLEDTDLCYRAAQRGLKIFYVPEASGRHFWGFSTGHYRFRRIVWHHCSIWRYFSKHGRSWPVLLGLGPLLLVNCFLSLTVELFTLRK